MARRLTIEELIEAVIQLKPEDRERLLRALKRDATEPMHHITELRGLGKEIWQGQDAQEYINAERDSWES
jgi:hypothetical protein